MISGNLAQGIAGTVRSYNGCKGYGFIDGPPGAFSDVMFSRSELPEDSKEVRGNFMEGRTVLFDAQVKPDGRAKATSIQIQPDYNRDMPGMIKSFNQMHGYGFLSSSCYEDDIRFQASDLPPLPSSIDLTGQLVIFRAMQGEDGIFKTTKLLFQTAKMAERLTGVSMTGHGGRMGAQLAMLTGMKRAAGMVGLGQPAFERQKSKPVPVTPTGKYMAGRIKSYNPAKGWGLISSPGVPSGGDGKPGDVFFMKSNLPIEVRDLDIAGYNVEYELMRASEGKLRAQNITIS